MQPALFIVLEGTDGSGTTTQGNLLAQSLRVAGHEVLRTAQPSDGPIGVVLRAALRNEMGHRLDPVAVALLFAADRSDHCHRVIGPALARGEWVVCDRYLGSSLAFQVVDGDGTIDEAWVLALNRHALVPDLSVLLDVPTDTAVGRIQERGKPRERFEIEDTLRNVRQRYRQVFASPPERLGPAVVVEADRPRESVAREVLAHVQRRQAEVGLALATGDGEPVQRPAGLAPASDDSPASGEKPASSDSPGDRDSVGQA